LRFFLRNFAWATVLMLVGVVAANAQSESATITGRITDGTGAVVPGVQIVLGSADRGTDLHATTNQTGIYVFPFVRPGVYNLTVQKQGFRSVDLVGLVANTQAHLEQNFQLSIGATSESTTVNGSVAVMEVSTGISTTIDQQFVKNMPLNGRDFQALIAMTPGAIRTGGAGLFSFNGQRDNTNYFTIDGVSANTGIGQTQGAALGQAGAGQAPTLSALGTTSSMLSLDALDQIKIQSANYAAEFGRSAGGQIQLTSRGGTDQYHGSLYNYFRNDVLNTWNAYTKFQNATLSAGLAKPPLRLNQFGGTFGGPVRIPALHNGLHKTFFFVSYEGARLRTPTSGSSETAPESVRNTTYINSALLPYVNLAPLPTGLDEYSEPALFASYSNASSTNTTSVRIDENVNSRLSLFGRFNYAPSYKSNRSTASLNELDTTHGDAKSLTLGTTYQLAPQVANELRANWSKSGGSLESTLDTFHGSTLPTDAMYAQMFPSVYGATRKNSMFVFGAYPSSWAEAYQVGSSTNNEQRQINVVDSVSFILGQHHLKAGVDWRYLFPVAAPTVYSPNVAYYSDADLLSGYATVGQVESRDVVVVHQQDMAFYLQDTWRPRPNLSLDLGLRWDYDPAPKAVDGQSLYVVENPTDPANATLAPAGTRMYPTNKTQFAPRIGATYILKNKDHYETLIKGGYGLFYVASSDTALQATNYFPHDRYTALFNIFWMTDPLPPVSSTSGPPYSNQNILGYYPGFTTPRVHEWNLSMQQNLGGQQSVTLAYVGSAGRKLTRMGQFSGSNYKSRFLNLTEYFSMDTSDYNSAQLSYVRTMSHGLQMLANYVFGKSLDTASGDTVIAASPTGLPISTERGHSSYDVRHSFNVSFGWEVPRLRTGNRLLSAVSNGWAMDGIVTARSGNPLNVYVSYKLATTGSANVRPDVVKGQPFWVKDSTKFGGKKLNSKAFDATFLTNGSGRLQGNEQRNSIPGWNFAEVEYTIRRDFKLGKFGNLQYRCDAFNLFNQTNYAPPNQQVGSISNGKYTAYSRFGASTNTYDTTTAAGNTQFGGGGSRVLQMALRYSF